MFPRVLHDKNKSSYVRDDITWKNILAAIQFAPCGAHFVYGHCYPERAIWQLTSEIVVPAMPILQDAWAPWYDLAPVQEERDARDNLACIAMECADWAELAEPLEAYWSRHGTGPLARYRLLRWQGSEEGLYGIAHPDPVQLSNLIGYEREQSLLKANTERFLAGLPAHDVLLFRRINAARMPERP